MEGTYKAVGSTSFTFVGDVGHISEHHREGYGKDTADGYHGEIPPSVDVNQWNRCTSEENCHQQEELPTPNVR